MEIESRFLNSAYQQFGTPSSQPRPTGSSGMAANSRETKFHGFSASQYLASIFAARLHLIHDSWYMTGHIILNAMPRPMISVKVHREIVPYLNPYSFFLSFFLLPNMLHHCRQTRVSVKLQKLAVNSRCIKSSTAAPSLCDWRRIE